MNIPENIGKPYALETDGDSAEITLYGEIVETRPVDFWTEKPVDGAFIIQDEFLGDLENIRNHLTDIKTLTIRVNSVGGDAGVSLLIHNRLRELADSGVSLRCVVDGVAMSGGSFIMCACDTVEINPASLVMIHQCRATIFGGYNSDELRQQADALTAWDRAAETVYHRKTGLSDTIIRHMMRNTTYMTGKEAVEKGFADMLTEDAEPLNIAASADRQSLFINGQKIRLPASVRVPDTIPTIPINPPKSSGKTKGECIMPQNPDEKNAVKNNAKNPVAEISTAENPVLAERRRIEEIDEFSPFCDPDTVREAKYGETACNAQEMLYRAAQKAKAQGRQFLAKLTADNLDSGVQNVTAEPSAMTPENPDGTGPQNIQVRAKNAVTQYLVHKGVK